MCIYNEAPHAEDTIDRNFEAARRSRAQAEETYRDIEKALKGRA